MSICRYDPNYHPAEAEERLSQDGLTDVELAEYFGIAARTFYEWQKRFPEFRSAVVNGKKPANKRVAGALYRKATGYTIRFTEITRERAIDKNGRKRLVVTKEVDKAQHVPADTQAAMFFLKNRDPEQWRDRQEHEITGKDGGPIETRIIIGSHENDPTGDKPG